MAGPLTISLQPGVSFVEALTEADKVLEASGEEVPRDFRGPIAALEAAACFVYEPTPQRRAVIQEEVSKIRLTIGLEKARTISSKNPALRRQMAEARRRAEAALPDLEDPPVQDAELFAEIARHGIIDMLGRLGHNYEIRRCAWCGKWLIPAIAGKGVFCSSSCRSLAYYQRARRTQNATFTCTECGVERDIDRFSGLQFIAREGDRPSVRIGSLFGGRGGDLLCADCVLAHHREWRRYLRTTQKKLQRPVQNQTEFPFYAFAEVERK